MYFKKQQRWGGVGMLTFIELAHMVDATPLGLGNFRCHATGFEMGLGVGWGC